jgi:hypothetical protein
MRTLSYGVSSLNYPKFIGKAKHTLMMFSELIKLSKPEIVDALKRASDSGVIIGIFHGPSDYKGAIDELREDGNVSFYPLKVHPERTVITADKKRVGMEVYHTGGDQIYPSIQLDDAEILALDLNERFAYLKTHCLQN